MRSLLEEALPQWLWVEKSPTLQIFVRGEGPECMITLSQESDPEGDEDPGPWELSVHLRSDVRDDKSADMIGGIRDRVSAVVGGFWIPTRIEPCSFVKVNNSFPSAYDFESEYGVDEMNERLTALRLWRWKTASENQSALAIRGIAALRMAGDEFASFTVVILSLLPIHHFRLIAGSAVDYVHTRIQDTILPALGARNLRPTPLETLVEMLASESYRDQRCAVLDAIRIYGGEARMAVLGVIKALHDYERNVRAFAARALGSIGPAAKEAIPALGELATSEDSYIANYAKKALELIQR